MKLAQVLETYDELYASEYDATFLHDEWARASVAFQLELLGRELEGARAWLDVACGTGFALSRFPAVERAGLDVSPAMLAVARRRNPGVTLAEGNFLDPRPEWDGRWDVVSCMWWAYCMVESLTEVRRLFANLARWTSDRGACFVPLVNPRKLDSENIRLPYVDPTVPGRLTITGITWSWEQENGKRHDDVLAPQVEYVAEAFEEHFETVRIVEGPTDAIGEGWRTQDVLVARGKRAR